MWLGALTFVICGACLLSVALSAFSSTGIVLTKTGDELLTGLPAKTLGVVCLIPALLILGGAAYLLLAFIARLPHSPVAKFIVCSVMSGIGMWVGSNANKRGMDGIVWGVVTPLALVLVLPLYLITRRPKLEPRESAGLPEPKGQILIRFSCPQCGKHFKVDERLAGKKGRCPCGNHIRLPDTLQMHDTIGRSKSSETTSRHCWISNSESRSDAVVRVVAMLFAVLFVVYIVVSS